MKTETLYRKKQVNRDAWIVYPCELTMYHRGNGVYEILEPVEVHVGEYYRYVQETTDGAVGRYEKVTHVLPSAEDSSELAAKVQELEKQLEEAKNESKHYQDVAQKVTNELESARKNAVVWEKSSDQSNRLDVGLNRLIVYFGGNSCTIPLPPQKDEAEEAWEKSSIKNETNESTNVHRHMCKGIFIEGFNAAKALHRAIEEARKK